MTRDDLERVLGDPFGQASSIDPGEARELAIKLSVAIGPLMQRAFDDQDRLLGLEPAAKLLNRTPRWIRDNARSLPFTLKLGDTWKCSEHGIQRFIADSMRRRRG
jgi:hypothetical protein